MDKDRAEEQTIQLPAPTAFPLACAFGITLLVSGLVTHWLVSLTGVIVGLYSAVGWFRQVYPHERHETVAFLPESERAKAPEHSPRTIQHLTPGKAGHRVRLPVEVPPMSAGIVGGLAGGAAMAVLALAYGLIFEGSLWWPVNLLSAVAIPSLTGADVETLKNFSMAGLIFGIFVHGTTSVLVGLVYAAVMPIFPKMAWLWAGILTPLFWSLVFYGSIGIIDPTLEQHVNWTAFVICQLAFGLVGGFVIARFQKIETMQTWPLALRAGIEGIRESGDDDDREDAK